MTRMAQTQPAQSQIQIDSFMTHSVNNKEFTVPIPRTPPPLLRELQRPSRHALVPTPEEALGRAH